LTQTSKGIGGEIDNAKAHEWCRRAAEAGSARALAETRRRAEGAVAGGGLTDGPVNGEW